MFRTRIHPLATLYESKKRVFSTREIRLYWSSMNDASLRNKLSYYTKQQQLQRLGHGVYAFPGEYEPFAVGNALIIPSYISLETALQYHGMQAAMNETIQSIGPYWRMYEINGRTYEYHKMSLSILSSPLGILQRDGLTIATAERALTDALYLCYEPSIDDRRGWDRTLLRELIKLYDVPRVEQGLRLRHLL